MKLLWNALLNYKKESILAPLLKMTEALLDLFVPLVMARIIDTGIGNADSAYVIRGCLILIALGAGGLAISITAQFFAARAAVGISSDLRHGLFEKITSFGYGELDHFGSGTLLTRMTSDINQIQNAVNLALRLLLRSPFIVFGAAVMAFTVSARAALIFVAAIPLLALVVFGIMKITRPMYKGVQTRLDVLTGIAHENIGGMRVVRAFGRGADETERFRSANAALLNDQMVTGRISSLMNPLTMVIVNLAIIAILNTGAVMVNAGSLTQGAVIALVNYMSQILIELVKLANLIVQISRGLASADRIEQLMALNPAMEYPEKGAQPVGDGNGEPACVFENVSFAYPGSQEDALEEISFSVNEGETIGIIGGTGSGKTSIVNLICRNYDTQGGCVRVFGNDVKRYEKGVLRAQIGLVPQKARLFLGTIRSNLLFGRENASDAELWEALDAACASEFVQKKEGGLDAEVEEGGLNFSGGQRQRLTIARALVRKPRILILDDSSSALDYATDALLRKNIRAMNGTMTIILISQRTNTIMNADRILVLDDGKMAGYASHAELLETCDIYRDIYESQYGK